MAMLAIQCSATSMSMSMSMSLPTSIKVTHQLHKPYLRKMMKMNAGTRRAAQLLSPAGAKELLSSVDAFIFDCDGLSPSLLAKAP